MNRREAPCGSAATVLSLQGDAVIRVENLSKSYLVGHRVSHMESLRDAAMRHVANAGRRVADLLRGRQVVGGDSVEEFWALDDVSFEVRRGEVFGIIGRNGAGKSTLLKILARITEPTRGMARLRGRVASLLEVGTGFHPELTGRENIFLNGAILGMTRQEVRAKFEEIVAFADVEKFLDTPVKRYSSGMYVRLAFAVAAHLEPEILIIDEVLAVGDIAFQKKCLGKVRDVAGAGRTVLFVSHNLPAITDLTARTLLIDRGRIRSMGKSREVVAEFLQMLREGGPAGSAADYRRRYRAEGHVDIVAVRAGPAPAATGVMRAGDRLLIDVDLDAKRAIEEGLISISLYNERLEAITTFFSADSKCSYGLAPGRHTIRCDAGVLPLVPGDYRLTVGAAQKGGGLAWDVLEMLPGFHVEAAADSAWLNWPERPGALMSDQCTWSRL